VSLSSNIKSPPVVWQDGFIASKARLAPDFGVQNALFKKCGSVEWLCFRAKDGKDYRFWSLTMRVSCGR
jgi:hypothetical protein